MKKVISVLALSLSFSAFAGHQEAKEAFMKDSAVQEAIQSSAQARHQRVEKQPGSAYLHGSCGFAGCDDTYLVTLPVRYEPGANRMSWSIAAKVTLSTYFPPKVEIVDSDKL